MPASNEEFIKKAFEAGLTEDQVRQAVAERNARLNQSTGETATERPSSILDTIASIPQFLLPQTSKTVQDFARDPKSFAPDARDVASLGLLSFMPQHAGTAVSQGGNLISKTQGAMQEVGSYMTPVGAGSILGRLGLGALSGASFGAAQEGATPTDIATSAGAGALVPGGSAIVGKGVNVVKEKVGQELVEQGKNLVLRSLKPTKTQLTNFQKKTGQDLADFLKEQKITSNFAEEVGQRLTKLQEQFNDLAMRDGVSVPTTKIREAFAKPIEDLGSSVIPAVKAKAGQLTEVADNIAAQYGETVPLADLTRIRRSFDTQLKDGQFSLSPEEANYLRSARDAVQNLVQETADSLGEKGELKRIGREIGKYIELGKIADKQAQLGRGTGVVQLRDALFAGLGGMTGGLPGIVAGVVTNRALQNPRVLSGASNALEGVGSALEQSGQVGLPDALMQLLRGAGVSSVTPKRKPQNEQDDRFDAMRRAQQTTQREQMRRPGLLP